MRHKRVFLTEKSDEYASYLLYMQGDTNRSERERMKKILVRAIKNELTERQRICLTLHYLEGMKLREIARRLGISVSTVSRHISAAEQKLRKVASYYEKLN